MQTEKYIVKAVSDTYKNAQIALHSLDALIPSVENENLINELKSERNGYNDVIKDISKYMDENHIPKKEINPLKKGMLWCSIKMKTAINNGKNHVAEMMINGTVMGINELQAMINEKTNYPQEVTDLIKKLLTLEEEYEQNLKKFL